MNLKMQQAIQSSLSKEDIEQLEIIQDVVKWAYVYFGWTAYDYQIPILRNIIRDAQAVFRLGRRLGKCIPGDVKIPDSITGEYITVDELYKRQKANVFSVDTDDNLIKPAYTNIVIDNGVKPVYEVTTTSGRKIKATGNHPLYTTSGWEEIDNLSVGDHVGIATHFSHTTPVNLEVNEIKLLAYMIGDGTTTTRNIRFSCSPNNIFVLNEMRHICSSLDSEMKQYDSDKPYDYHITKKDRKTKNVSKVYSILSAHKMIGKNAHTKTIPNAIYKLDKRHLSIFLSRLYATDGWASTRNIKKFNAEIGYASVSRPLVEGVQSLLLRFGIQSSIYQKTTRCGVSYSLIISGSKYLKLFIDNIDIFGKHSATRVVQSKIEKIECVEYVPTKQTIDDFEAVRLKKGIKSLRSYGIRLDKRYSKVESRKLKEANKILKDSTLNKYYDNNIYWDEIKSIEYVGDLQTYDLDVPGYQNFVANDFITHNTEMMCILILWYAFTQYNKKIVTNDTEDVYNILIVAPFEKQIDLIFKRLKELIAASPAYQDVLVRDVKHNLKLKNGTNILGITAGSKTGSGANNTRGQGADLIVFDEVDKKLIA